MIREHGLENVERREDSVITVGTFDGVHRGHQAILNYVIERARKVDGQSVVLSFDPHPREVLQGKPMPLLTTIEERASLLQDIGIDRFVVLPFTREFSQQSAEEYVRRVLVEGIGVREMVVGHDHTFGRGGEGDSDLLNSLGEQFGFSLDIIPAQVVEKTVVSSTRIRALLKEDGNVSEARELLGRSYKLTGAVVAGDRRGRTIGFPTANIQIENDRKIVPRDGVYAVKVRLPDGKEAVHPGMMNIGWRPTFNGRRHVLEVHLLDFEGDLYGQHLRVSFIERIRDEQQFDGPDALVAQLEKDRKTTRRLLQGTTGS